MTRNEKCFRRLLLAAAGLLLAPSFASAQFPGDVFFAEPSVAAPEGGTAELEVLFFAGAQPLGAAHFEVLFDPDLAEVAGVEAGTTEQLAPGHVAVTTPGRAAIVDLNTRSLNAPIGTVSLARLEVRPLAAAGTRVPLAIQVRSLLRPDSTEMPGRGFAGEILVVSAAQGGQSLGSLAAAAGVAVETGSVSGELASRADAFRRPGAAVDLLDFRDEGDGVSVVRRRVMVPDPAAPGDAPPPSP